jgi:hypothetical protein
MLGESTLPEGANKLAERALQRPTSLKLPHDDNRHMHPGTGECLCARLEPDLHRQAVRVQQWRPLGNAAMRPACGEHDRTCIQHVVAFRAGADPRLGDPPIDLAKA